MRIAKRKSEDNGDFMKYYHLEVIQNFLPSNEINMGTAESVKRNRYQNYLKHIISKQKILTSISKE